MIEKSLAAAPFNLDATGLAWVKKTFERLTPDQRLAQLFVLRSGVDKEAFERIKAFAPGGITAIFGPDPDSEIKNIADLARVSPVPPLISADLEGSRLSLPFGTQVLNPLGLAVVNDVAATAEISRIMAEEGRAAGVNWTFTPVLDINAAFRSAIVATRGFGSNVDTIERHALIQLKMFQEHGIAVTAKHWPGEGYDDRDQHLVTTVNPQTVEEWERTFGRLYRAAIKAGVLSVMSGHIAFPAFAKSIDAKAGVEAFRPASMSKILNITLLREKLGFNGLIVSDATPMAGLGAWAGRKEAIPQVIAGGCDVILFSGDPEADMAALRAAMIKGELEQSRVDDAVMRVLGLKAALKLHLPRRPRRAGVWHQGKQGGCPRDLCASADLGQGRAEPAAARPQEASAGTRHHARHRYAVPAASNPVRIAGDAQDPRFRSDDARVGNGRHSRAFRPRPLPLWRRDVAHAQSYLR